MEEKTSYIVFITPVDGVEVPIGTAEADAIAKLASETTITDSDDETHTVALEWTIADYDGNTPGDYTATGTFELPEGVEQSDPPKELKVITIVTVQKGGSGSVPASGVSISEDDQMLEVGNTVQLTAVVEPEDATDKSVTWSS
ncbi:MAG: Ig-like domain-containing protein [Dethiobacteria bacterium]